MKKFGVMLDMSRNAVMKPEKVKEFADIIRSFGYNMIQLYTEDTYTVEGEPYFGHLRGRYSEEELRDIVDYCNSIGVEVIPCIQTLAHLNQIFKWNTYEPINDMHNILLCENERTYELIENMFKSLRRSFKSDYVHIGMDEAHALGLGRYLDLHGYQNRHEILMKHLKKVIEIAERYDFKPIMWSDMFFRLANNGNYDPPVTEDVIAITPRDVGLVYWDYYANKKNRYDTMFEAHLKFPNEVWFAGGAWTWPGLVSANKTTIETMTPAMISAKEHGIENVLITMWGDDGKECSFYSVLPSLFAIKKLYDGESDMDKIKEQFKEATGESFDDMCDLDLPNLVGGNTEAHCCIAKSMLYNDPFLGIFDSGVREGVREEYEAHAKKLRSHASRSISYKHLFEANATLCELLSHKYDLGVRLRNAYKAGDLKELLELADEIAITRALVKDYHGWLYLIWHSENKPHGFEVQDQRLGGLIMRLETCYKRLMAYLKNDLKSLPELEEEVLDWFGGAEQLNTERYPAWNNWKYIASASVI